MPGLALSINPVTAVQVESSSPTIPSPSFSHCESAVIQLLICEYKRVLIRTLICTNIDSVEQRDDDQNEGHETEGFYLLQCDGQNAEGIVEESFLMLIGSPKVVEGETDAIRDYVTSYLGTGFCYTIAPLGLISLGCFSQVGTSSPKYTSWRFTNQ
jgi:hypothetical protein